MPIFGLDISHHQGTNPDMIRAKNEGIKFVICKATEGNSFVDSRFRYNMKRVLDAGMLVAAYHYQRGHVSARSQAEHIMRNVPQNVPVILDVEDNGGDVELSRQIIRILRGFGYKCPLIYLPEWYWNKIGKPSLHDLPPNWKSRYPDNRQGSIASEYAMVPASYWNGFGGLPTAILQFTSSGVVGGYGPLDVNAFRGTQRELEDMLLGSVKAPEKPKIEEEDMTLSLSLKDAGDRERVDGLSFEVSEHSAMWKRAWLQITSMAGKHVVKIEFLHDTGVIPNAVWTAELVEGDPFQVIPVPAYCRGARITYKVVSATGLGMNNCLSVSVFGSKELA